MACHGLFDVLYISLLWSKNAHTIYFILTLKRPWYATGELEHSMLPGASSPFYYHHKQILVFKMLQNQHAFQNKIFDMLSFYDYLFCLLLVLLTMKHFCLIWEVILMLLAPVSFQGGSTVHMSYHAPCHWSICLSPFSQLHTRSPASFLSNVTNQD